MGNNVLQELIDLNEEARDPFLLQIQALKEYKQSNRITDKIYAVVKFKQAETLGIYKFREFRIFVENNIERIVKQTGANYLKRLTQEFMKLQKRIDTLKQNVSSKKKSVIIRKLNNSQEQKIQTIHPNSLF